VGVVVIARKLTYGNYVAIPAIAETKNTKRYREDSWLRREDSNLRMAESKSAAVPIFPVRERAGASAVATPPCGPHGGWTLMCGGTHRFLSLSSKAGGSANGSGTSCRLETQGTLARIDREAKIFSERLPAAAWINPSTRLTTERNHA
jgi:hypothetical protein